jgi:hypothetical protein
MNRSLVNDVERFGRMAKFRERLRAEEDTFLTYFEALSVHQLRNGGNPKAERNIVSGPAKFRTRSLQSAS